MRRRQKPEDPQAAPPQRLCRFREQEWEGWLPNPVQAWYDARSEWYEADPERDLPEPDYWPDAPFDPESV
jgi:hypothetical protein